MDAERLKQLLKNGVYRTIGETALGLGQVHTNGDRSLVALMYHKVNDRPGNVLTIPI